jgi:hypothetical protein
MVGASLTALMQVSKEVGKLNLVKIEPIEYQRKMPKGKHSRILTYWGFSFSPHITQNDLDRIVRMLRTKQKVAALNNPDELIFWQYSGAPLIILNKLRQSIFTIEKDFKRFAERTCQQQASLVLRVLKKHGLAQFRRNSLTVNPKKFGRNSGEREQTFQAIRYLVQRH